MTIGAFEQGDLSQDRERSYSDLSRSLHQAIDDIPQMLWIGGNEEEGFYNRAWHEFVGAPPASLNSRNSFLLIHPEDREKVKRRWEKAIANRQPFEEEYRLSHHSG